MARSKRMEIAIIPAPLLRPFCSDPARRLQLNLGLSSLLVMICFLVISPASLAHIPHVCLFRSLLGVPCPGCGITTSLFALARFDMRSSVLANPAGVLVAASLMAQASVNSWMYLQRRSAAAASRLLRITAGATLPALVLVWVLRLISIVHS